MMLLPPLPGLITDAQYIRTRYLPTSDSTRQTRKEPRLHVGSDSTLRNLCTPGNLSKSNLLSASASSATRAPLGWGSGTRPCRRLHALCLPARCLGQQLIRVSQDYFERWHAFLALLAVRTKSWHARPSAGLSGLSGSLALWALHVVPAFRTQNCSVALHPLDTSVSGRRVLMLLSHLHCQVGGYCLCCCDGCRRSDQG